MISVMCIGFFKQSISVAIGVSLPRCALAFARLYHSTTRHRLNVPHILPLILFVLHCIIVNILDCPRANVDTVLHGMSLMTAEQIAALPRHEDLWFEDGTIIVAACIAIGPL